MARSEKDLEKVVNRVLQSHPEKAESMLTYSLDVQDEKAIQAMAASIVSKFEQINY